MKDGGERERERARDGESEEERKRECERTSERGEVKINCPPIVFLGSVKLVSVRKGRRKKEETARLSGPYTN